MDTTNPFELYPLALVALIETNSRAAYKAMMRHEEPLAAYAIQEVLRHAEALTNHPDCPKL